MIALEHPIPVTWVIGEENGEQIKVTRFDTAMYFISHPHFQGEYYDTLHAAFLAFEAYARKDAPPANLSDLDLCTLAERWVEGLDSSNGNYYPLRMLRQCEPTPPCREVFLELVRRVREKE